MNTYFSCRNLLEKEKRLMNEDFTMQRDHLKAQFTMAQAQVEDTEDVLSLLMETAEWFKDNGSTQWSGLLNGIDAHRTEEAVGRGDVFICKVEAEVVGMVMLLQRPSAWDRNLWNLHEEQSNEAVYLHRLATRRKYANQQLGEEILNWCKDSIRFQGKDKIRLDCLADNEFLNAFYQRGGYTYIGENEGYSLYEQFIE